MACPLCEADGGVLVHRATRWRVIRAEEANFPTFYRVVWNDHVAELSDLSDADRAECLAVVVAVERVLRAQLSPTKINLAALGNVVPHLHWHVIARFADDTHFPDPVWALARRTADETLLARLRRRLPLLDDAVRIALAAHR
jgi:diadenosine tetraphosphate (Ap4A) HIT family hydrolase